MVYIKPPICEDSDNIQLCMTTVKDIYTLRYELKLANRVQDKIKERIQKYKKWTKSKIQELWPIYKKLAKTQQQIRQLENAIQEYTTIRSDVDYKELLKYLGKGEISDMVIKQLGRNPKEMTKEQIASILSGTSQQQFLMTFGKKQLPGILGKKELQQAFAKSILDSIAEDSKKVKVQNKQFDLDLETLERNLETAQIDSETQIQSMEDQIALFKELQERNIGKISDELVEELDLLRALLGTDTLKLIIQYVNLYGGFLDQINKLSRETPIETNAAKLITFLSKTDKMDVTSYVKMEQNAIQRKIKQLEKQYENWERYKTSIETVMFKLTSSSPEIVKEALADVYNTIAEQKPSSDVEEVKIEAQKRLEADRIRAQIAEVKGYIESGTLDPREGEEFIKIAEQQLMGLGYDLSGLDIFEEVAASERKLQERKANIERVKEKQELNELKLEKEEKEEERNQELYDKIGELEVVNMEFNFLVKYEFAFLAMMKNVENKDPSYLTNKQKDFKESLTVIIDLKEKLAIKQFNLMMEINFLAIQPTNQEIIKKDSRLPVFIKNLQTQLQKITTNIGGKWEDIKNTRFYKIPANMITKLTNTMTSIYINIRDLIKAALGIKAITSPKKMILTISQLIEKLDTDKTEDLLKVDQVYKDAESQIGEDPLKDIKKIMEDTQAQQPTLTDSQVINNIFTQAEQKATANNLGFGSIRVRKNNKNIRRRSNVWKKKKKTRRKSKYGRKRRSRRKHEGKNNRRRSYRRYTKSNEKKQRRRRRSIRRGSKISK